MGRGRNAFLVCNPSPVPERCARMRTWVGWEARCGGYGPRRGGRGGSTSTRRASSSKASHQPCCRFLCRLVSILPSIEPCRSRHCRKGSAADRAVHQGFMRHSVVIRGYPPWLRKPEVAGSSPAGSMFRKRLPRLSLWARVGRRFFGRCVLTVDSDDLNRRPSPGLALQGPVSSCSGRGAGSTPIPS
jgi:hypothetical protein